MKICKIKPQATVDSLVAKVISKETPREFTNFRGGGKVCDAVVKDSTGKTTLTLWNDQIDKIKTGDRVFLDDGWAKEFQGKVCISTGKNGILRTLSDKGKPSDLNKKRKKMGSWTDGLIDKHKLDSTGEGWADALISKRYSQKNPIMVTQRNIDSTWSDYYR